MLRGTLIVAAILKAKKLREEGQVRGRGRKEIIFPPLSSPSSILKRTTSPLESVFNPPQLSVMPNSEDGRRTLVPQKWLCSRCKIHLLYSHSKDQRVNLFILQLQVCPKSVQEKSSLF